MSRSHTRQRKAATKRARAKYLDRKATLRKTGGAKRKTRARKSADVDSTLKVLEEKGKSE